jgi:hypothetical protein
MSDQEWDEYYEEYMFVWTSEEEQELYPGSKTRKVTRSNVEEYIELQCKFHLNRAKNQMTLIKNGMARIAPECLIHYHWT